MQLRKRALGHAAAAAGVAPAVATPAPPAKRRQPRAGSRAAPKAIKVYQDIGIEHLLLGAGAQGVATPAVVTASQLGGVAPFADMAALQGACAELAKADPTLAPLIETHGPPVRLLAKSGSSFATLAKGICFQQLATAAAAAIYGRVLQVCKAPDVLTPSAVLAAPTTELRAAGLSERKVSYLRDLSDHFLSGHISDELTTTWDGATLHHELVKVKGLGDWSVDMFSMFHLGHTDVLPTGDLGVRRGMQVHFGLPGLPTPADMQKLTAVWKPFRSVGCFYMWRVPVSSNKQQQKKKKKKK